MISQSDLRDHWTHGAKPMKRVGFWASSHEPGLPDVGKCVDPTWSRLHPEEWAAVVVHLQRGETKNAYKGSSTCRICGMVNGSTDLSDGVWLWPEGFRHYITVHDVKPPQEFIDHCVQLLMARMPKPSELQVHLESIKVTGVEHKRECYQVVETMKEGEKEVGPLITRVFLTMKGLRGEFAAEINQQVLERFVLPEGFKG